MWFSPTIFHVLSVLNLHIHSPNMKDSEMEISLEQKKEDEHYCDKAFKGSFGLSFWFKSGGLMLGGRNAGPWIIPVSFMISSPTVILFLTFTAWATKNTDVEVFCEAIHFFMFISIELIFQVMFCIKRKKIEYQFTLMGKGFYDYENTLDEDCIKKVRIILDEADKKKKIIAQLFTGVVMCACVAITILRPLIKYLIGESETRGDGVLRLLPVPIWTPFSPTGAWYLTLIFFVLEDIISYITPGIVFGCTLFVVCTCEDLGAQLTILGLTLKSVSERAKCLNMPRDEAIKLCFKHSIKHHQTLVRFAKNLEDVVYIPGFGLLFGSTILMCMSGFIFVSTEVSLISKTVFCLFLVSELAIIFIFCWYGEYVQQTSTQVCDMVYSSEWVDDMKAMKYYVLIIQARTIRPIKINFGGFMYASLETYSNICSSAFSYFNLLLAVNNN